MTRRSSGSVKGRRLARIDALSAPTMNASLRRDARDGRDISTFRSDAGSSLTGLVPLLSLWLADVSAEAVQRSMAHATPVKSLPSRSKR